MCFKLMTLAPMTIAAIFMSVPPMQAAPSANPGRDCSKLWLCDDCTDIYAMDSRGRALLAFSGRMAFMSSCREIDARVIELRGLRSVFRDFNAWRKLPDTQECT